MLDCRSQRRWWLARFGTAGALAAIGMWALSCILSPTIDAAKTIVFTEYATAANAELRQRQLDMFEKVTGIHVDYQPLEWFPALEKYPVMLAAGSYPDLWMFPPQLWDAFAQSHEAFVDLRPYVEGAGYDISLLPRGQVEAGTVEGRWIGLASYVGWAPSYDLLAYNKGFLSQAGVADLDPGLTWQDLYLIDQKLTRDISGDSTVDIAGSTIGIHGSSAHEGVVQNILRAYGGSFVKNDLSGANVQDPRSVAAFRFIKQFVDTYRESGLELSWFAFSEGDAAIYMGGPQNILTEYQGLERLGMEMGVTILPRGPVTRGYIRQPETDMGPGTPVFPFVIPKGPNQEEAWRLFEFLVFDPRSLEVYSGMNVIPTVYYRPNLEGMARNLGPVARMLLPRLQEAEAEAVTMLWNPAWGIELEMGNGRGRDIMTEYMQGQVSLAQMLSNLERFINAQLAAYSDRVEYVQGVLKRAGLI
ncbi:MAG TPA: extracellular solute-binding protein [Limnochordia bacterium]